MLTLNDGRSELWQWDTKRKLTVDAECSQVHFSNKIFGRSIDVDVVNGIATIPDILLQTDKELNAWAFVGTAENGYTKISKTFKVNQRNKPSDYVFTPPDQTTLQEIEEKIKHIESIEFPVTSVNNKTGDVELNADDVGAISQDDLQAATDAALSQAKESGLFDGEPGKNGVDGHTPEYGVDYGTPEQIAGIAQQAADILSPDLNQIKGDLSDKLPKSPANWEPWTAEEQAAARERMGIPGNYELIADITLDEEIRVVSINFEEYLSEMYVVFSGTSTGSGNSTVDVVFDDDTTQIYASCCVGWMNTSKRYAYAHISLNQGILRSESMGAQTNDTWGTTSIYTNGRGLALLTETQKSIKAINIATLNNNNWCAGCKFTVYGVRA